MNGRKGKGKPERYVWLRFWLLDSPAWRSLPGNARALYIELARRYNGSNNGRIPYSVREAVQALGIGKSTTTRLLDILEDRGFIVYTKRGAFSLKTVKEASEWRLTEYDSDAPVAHASKDFMRWRPPEDIDIDTMNRQPSQRRKFRTRYPQRDHTVPVAGPHGTCGGTVKPKKARNGTHSGTVKAKNDPPTVPVVGHLQIPGGVRPLPGRATEQGRIILVTAVPDTATVTDLPSPKLPWSPPTLTEIPFDSLPTELRMMALGLPVLAAVPVPVSDIRDEDDRPF
jgi:hypothetical protein